jgi:hypothetical protein
MFSGNALLIFCSDGKYSIRRISVQAMERRNLPFVLPTTAGGFVPPVEIVARDIPPVFAPVAGPNLIKSSEDISCLSVRNRHPMVLVTVQVNKISKRASLDLNSSGYNTLGKIRFLATKAIRTT